MLWIGKVKFRLVKTDFGLDYSLNLKRI